GFDLFRYIGRIDYDDISADRLELGHKLRPPDDVYSLQAARFRKRDDPTPDPGIGRVLHHPLARLQVDVLAEQQRRGRRIDRQHCQLLSDGGKRQGEKFVGRNNHSFSPSEAGKRGQYAVADLDVLHSWPYGENAADTFIADDGWKSGAHSVDAPCEQEVALVERGKLNPDQNLVRARSLGLWNVDILKTLEGVAIGCELNSAHIDVSY